MNSLLILLPDFTLIISGLAIKKWLISSDDFWSGLEKLVYFVLFPALLLSAVMRTEINISQAAPMIICALLSMAFAAFLALVYGKLSNQDKMTFVSVFQCSFRFNSYLGLAVVGAYFGKEGISTLGLILAVAVPLANIAAVSILANISDRGLWRELIRNPLIVATSCGLILNLLGVHLAAPLQIFANRLGDASIALGLICVGAALRFAKNSQSHLDLSIVILAIKLLIMPTFAFFLSKYLDLSSTYRNIVVLFAALPTASSAYILAMRMGGDGNSVAWQISVSTLLSMLTMPFWVYCLN